MASNNIPGMDISLRQLIYKETRNVLVANLVISCFLTWLTLPKQELLNLLGGIGSAGFGFYPASFLFSSSVTILLGKILQEKVLTGKLVIDVDIKECQVLNMLPRGLLARSTLIGLFCMFIVAPATLFLLNFTLGSEWTYTGAFIINVIYLEILTLVVVPVVVRTSIMGVLKGADLS